MLTTDKTVSKDSLTDLVQKWGTSTFGIDFKYRPFQKECIVDIIWNWFNNYDDIILDAPTGSGKSFIAMAVAGVLSTYFGKKGNTPEERLEIEKKDLYKIANYAIIMLAHEYGEQYKLVKVENNVDN